MASRDRDHRRVKALAICGSARPRGNTALLLRKVLEGAQAAGATTELVFPSELELRGCLGCGACKAPGASGCVIEDDMQGLYRKLEQANLWVMGTPVYWFHVSAHLKAVIDRLYALFTFDGEYHRRLEGERRGVAVVVQEARNDEGAREVAAYLERVMSACGAQSAGSLVGARLRDEGAAAEREDLMEEATALGATAVAALRGRG